MARTAAYFISDAHLGRSLSTGKNREKLLIAFLLEIRKNAKHLFILGDLFDFWVEYTFAIRPDYFEVLHALKLLSSGGTEIHYLAGNHDFALGSFLEDKVGIHIHMDQLSIYLQGKNLYLAHGDGLLPCDSGYLLLRRILRNPINQKLFKLLHPNLGVSLAGVSSRISRRCLDKEMILKKKAQYRQWAKGCLINGNDIVILGHTHVPELLNINGKIYCNTGEWMNQYTYATLEKGDIRLKRYIPHGDSQEISPVDFP